MSKILVTPRSLTKNGHPALKKLEKAGFEVMFCSSGIQPPEEELIKLLPDCIGYLAGVEKISGKVLESAKQLKVISRNGVGINNIDIETASKLNIKVLKTPGANARGVAELTFAHILAAVRSIAFCDRCLKQQNWQRRKGLELEGKTLGLIGCGNIGKAVARFALGFDMKVLAYDPFKDEGFKPLGDFRYCKFEDLIVQSDIVSLHCPPAEDGKALIDAGVISKMKDGVYIINTARAELLDNDVVLKALDEDKIAGLTIDVFSTEPPEDWGVAKHPSVTATSHIGGFTEESVDRAVERSVKNLLKELSR